MNTTKLTAKERGIINKFCLHIATDMIFSNKCIRRPLTMDLLNNAFAEVEQQSTTIMQGIGSGFDNLDLSISRASLTDTEKSSMLQDLRSQLNTLIDHIQDSLSALKNNYTVNVNMLFPDEKGKALYLSFNPVVTFWYSNCLHEQYHVTLTNELRELFAQTELCNIPEINDIYCGCGNFYLPQTGDSYENINMYVGEQLILQTITGDDMYELHLNTQQLKAFETFEDQPERNKQIIKKLKSRSKYSQ